MRPSVIVERSEVLDRAGFVHGFSGAGADAALARSSDELVRNIRMIGGVVGFDAGRLFSVRQVHGTATHVADLAAGDPVAFLALEGDAVVALPGAPQADARAAVGVRVADCVPILVGCERSGAVAAIHAGWRGIEAGVIGVAVEALRRLAPGGGHLAAIGPHIGACCFEVTEGIADAIARAASEPRVITARYGEGKAKVDLRLAARAQLRAAGLAAEAIDDVGGCAQCARAEGVPRYHSFRRDGAASGRMLAAISPRVR
ncbi:MAG TPA: polyphenol oxidase family protein [Polyangiaceae bacterium]|nr:polyphenol oxidase family protein [Polyangiaceae bacterium]